MPSGATSLAGRPTGTQSVCHAAMLGMRRQHAYNVGFYVLT